MSGSSESRPPLRPSANSSCVDWLTLRTLIRTASGKGGGRNAENEVTTRARHEGLLKLRLKKKLKNYAVIDKDEDGSR